jgi:hypothetical protein
MKLRALGALAATLAFAFTSSSAQAMDKQSSEFVTLAVGARAGSADFPCKEVELGSSPRCSTIITCASVHDLPICGVPAPLRQICLLLDGGIGRPSALLMRRLTACRFEACSSSHDNSGSLFCGRKN